MKLHNIVIGLIVSLALVGGVDARPGSFSSGRSSSSSSSSRSYSYSSPRTVSRPTTPPPSFAQKAAPAPRTATQQGYQSRPSVTTGVTRPPNSSSGSWFGGRSYSHGPGNTTIIHEHHYFGGGYGYGHGYYGGYSGGFGSSPFFWLWLLDRPQAQPPVIVQQPAQIVQGAPGIVQQQPAPVEQVVQEGPGVFMTIVNVFLGLLMLVAVVALFVWIIRKLIAMSKD